MEIKRKKKQEYFFLTLVHKCCNYHSRKLSILKTFTPDRTIWRSWSTFAFQQEKTCQQYWHRQRYEHWGSTFLNLWLLTFSTFWRIWCINTEMWKKWSFTYLQKGTIHISLWTHSVLYFVFIPLCVCWNKFYDQTAGMRRLIRALICHAPHLRVWVIFSCFKLFDLIGITSATIYQSVLLGI